MSALFTYTRTEKVNNQSVTNDNYINPAHVISMYWAVTEAGARVLNIFTSAVIADDKGGSKTMRITFGERTGERFVEHVETFLMLGISSAATYQPAPATREHNEKRGPRTYGNVIDPDLEVAGNGGVAWEQAQA